MTCLDHLEGFQWTVKCIFSNPLIDACPTVADKDSDQYYRRQLF